MVCVCALSDKNNSLMLRYAYDSNNTCTNSHAQQRSMVIWVYGAVGLKLVILVPEEHQKNIG